jgi:hypothetical protein
MFKFFVIRDGGLIVNVIICLNLTCQSSKSNASATSPHESITSHHFVQCVCSQVLRIAVDRDDMTVAKDLHCFWINALVTAPGWMNV